MKVIIDTNALMIPAKFKVDIFSELGRLGYEELLVPTAVVEELKKISTEARREDKVAANVASSLLSRCKVVEVDGFADDVILRLAKEEGAAVFTSDIELKRRAINEGLTVVYLRQKKHLVSSKE